MALPRWTTLAIVTCLTASVAWAQTTPGAATPPPKQTSIAVVIQKLRREAYDGWKQNKAWPRTAPDFAADMNWTVPEADILRSLGRQLDRNPTMDAYIKWQLLSFAPDLRSTSAEQFAIIFNQAARPLSAPEPQIEKGRGGGQDAMMFFGRQISYVRDLDPVVGNGSVAFNPRIGVVGEGDAFSVTGSAQLLGTVQRANEKLTRAREVIGVANRPVLAYRDALIERGSAHPQVQLQVLIKDVQDRLAAGDPTYTDAMARLIAQGPQLAKDKAINDAARQSMAEWLREIGGMRTKVVTEVGLDRTDFEFRGIQFALVENDVQKLVGYILWPTKPAPQATP